MKKIFLFAIIICFSFILQTQFSKTSNDSPYRLKTLLTAVELSTTNNYFTHKDNSDTRDFNTIRDDIQLNTNVCRFLGF